MVLEQTPAGRSDVELVYEGAPYYPTPDQAVTAVTIRLRGRQAIVDYIRHACDTSPTTYLMALPRYETNVTRAVRVPDEVIRYLRDDVTATTTYYQGSGQPFGHVYLD